MIVPLLLLPVLCLGQVNIEDRRMDREKSGFGGTIRVSLDLERGNSDLTEIALKPNFAWRSGRNHWFMLNSLSFVKTDRNGVVDEGFSHLRYNYDLTDRVLLEALAQVQYDREQDLRRRILSGGGLRFELLRRESNLLAVGLTAMYEYEELESGEIIRTPRNSDYIAFHVRGKEYLTLSSTLYVQPAFDDIGDVRVLDNLALTVALARWVSLTHEFGYRYDSRPPEGIRDYDLSMMSGLAVSF